MEQASIKPMNRKYIVRLAIEDFDTKRNCSILLLKPKYTVQLSIEYLWFEASSFNDLEFLFNKLN